MLVLKMYRSPKYWKEMALLRKEHEAKIKSRGTPETEPQASSSKQQATSNEELEGLKKYVKEKKKPI